MLPYVSAITIQSVPYKILTTLKVSFESENCLDACVQSSITYYYIALRSHEAHKTGILLYKHKAGILLYKFV